MPIIIFLIRSVIHSYEGALPNHIISSIFSIGNFSRTSAALIGFTQRSFSVASLKTVFQLNERNSHKYMISTTSLGEYLPKAVILFERILNKLSVLLKSFVGSGVPLRKVTSF